MLILLLEMFNNIFGMNFIYFRLYKIIDKKIIFKNKSRLNFYKPGFDKNSLLYSKKSLPWSHRNAASFWSFSVISITASSANHIK